MEVILLGTGGPRPDPRRMATTTLIRLGEENILIDAGRGVMVQLSKAGVPLGSINTVFLTHHHFAHIGDLYDVMLNSWLHGRKDDLRIYGPPDTERLVNTLVTQVYDKDITWRDQGEPSFGGWKQVVATDIIPGPVLDTGRWKISAELVSHGDGLDISPAFLARWMCLGYRFEADRGPTFLYSIGVVEVEETPKTDVRPGGSTLDEGRVSPCSFLVQSPKNPNVRELVPAEQVAGQIEGQLLLECERQPGQVIQGTQGQLQAAELFGIKPVVRQDVLQHPVQFFQLQAAQRLAIEPLLPAAFHIGR